MSEPGYYADGEYGTRIENVVIVCEVQTPNNFGNKGFLGFEHVTMVFPFRLTSLGRADQLSRRPLMGETSSTCLFSPWTNVRGWMRIIKGYGRKFPHCSRAMQELKRGCIASARHYDHYDAVVALVYLKLGPWDSCLHESCYLVNCCIWEVV